MTSYDLFTILASPSAREVLNVSIGAASNDDERAIDQPCRHCGCFFDSGVYDIVNGHVVDIKCADCEPFPK